MYKVKLDGRYLYHPWDAGLSITAGKLTQELNKNGIFDFSIPFTHPLAGSILRRKSVVEVIRFGRTGTEELIYRGCCMNDTGNAGFELEVETDGDLVFLQDSVIRPYGLSHDVKRTPSEQFAWLVGQHNTQVDAFKCFTVGITNVAGVSEERRETGYSTTREAVDKLMEAYGGFIRARTSGGVRYIDYLSSIGDASGQEVRQGKNIIDVTKYVKTDGRATRSIPTGSETNDEPPLTIKSENNGEDYIQDDWAVQEFGAITKVVEFPDISDPAELLKSAREYLEGTKGAELTVELSTVDLADAGLDIECIRVGDIVPCIAPAYGLSVQMQVSKRVTDILHPDKSRITLGASLQTLTQKQLNGEAGLFPMVRRAVSMAGEAASSASQAAGVVQGFQEQIDTKADKNELAGLKKVAYTGNYLDLDNKPAIPEAVRVKGEAESSYRTGDVDITKENIGLGDVPGRLESLEERVARLELAGVN